MCVFNYFDNIINIFSSNNFYLPFLVHTVREAPRANLSANYMTNEKGPPKPAPCAKKIQIKVKQHVRSIFQYYN